MNLVAWPAFLILLQLLPASSGYPTIFVKLYPHQTCTEHPTKAVGQHGTPEEDTISHVDLMSDGVRHSTFCAGANYNLTVTFPTPRLGLLTTSLGTSSSDTCSAGVHSPDCCSDSSGSRWLLTTLRSDKQYNFSVALKVPCGVSGPLAVRVTSATGNMSPFYQLQKQFEPGKGCAVCGSDPDLHKAQQPVPASNESSKTVVQQQDSPNPANTNQTSRIALCKGSSPLLSDSHLGYSHKLHLQGVTLHYSHADCAPANPCTLGATWGSDTTAPANKNVLHVAAEAKTKGYVALGFGLKAGQMAGTEAVLGYVEDDMGTGFVEAFQLADRQLGYTLTGPQQFMLYSGVVQTSDGRTMVCFSRELPAGQKLDGPMAINWAVGNRDTLGQHSQDGGAWVIFGQGRADIVGKGGMWTRNVHGIVMLSVWFCVVPLGAMSARHRWLLGDKMIWGWPRWLLVHQLLQSLALLLQLSAGVYAWLKFIAGPGLGLAHQVMGLTAMVLSCLQVAGAILRQQMNQKWHTVWQTAHKITGPILLVLSATTCVIGSFLMHTLHAQPLISWLLPCLVALVVLASLDGCACIWFVRSQKRQLAQKGRGLPSYRTIPTIVHVEAVWDL